MGKKADTRIMADFMRKVRREYKIVKAIFFGSRARGDNFKNSDYDVILVSPDFRGVFFTKRIAEMYTFWTHYPLEIELLCYTPGEFESKKVEAGIVRQAVKEGVSV